MSGWPHADIMPVGMRLDLADAAWIAQACASLTRLLARAAPARRLTCRARRCSRRRRRCGRWHCGRGWSCRPLRSRRCHSRRSRRFCRLRRWRHLLLLRLSHRKRSGDHECERSKPRKGEASSHRSFLRVRKRSRANALPALQFTTGLLANAIMFALNIGKLGHWRASNLTQPS